MPWCEFFRPSPVVRISQDAGGEVLRCCQYFKESQRENLSVDNATFTVGSVLDSGLIFNRNKIVNVDRYH